MMTIEEIKAALEDRNLAEVARRTGIGYMTLRRIMSPDNARSTDPRASTIKKLTDYLSKD